MALQSTIWGYLGHLLSGTKYLPCTSLPRLFGVLDPVDQRPREWPGIWRAGEIHEENGVFVICFLFLIP